MQLALRTVSSRHQRSVGVHAASRGYLDQDEPGLAGQVTKHLLNILQHNTQISKCDIFVPF